MERIDKLKPDVFLDGPGEYLVKSIVAELLKVEQWKKIFGDCIDPYKRMDYGMRNLPSLRVYSNGCTKEHESWFVTGDVILDMILPASLRRNELQQVQDTLSSAMMQQFRRKGFFNTIDALVPGLNELGKRFTVDKSLGFEWGEQIVPLTQMTVNFRLDLRQWDRYLEEQDRTIDDPFVRTLGNLEQIAAVIEGLKTEDPDSKEAEIELDQNIGGDE